MKGIVVRKIPVMARYLPEEIKSLSGAVIGLAWIHKTLELNDLRVGFSYPAEENGSSVELTVQTGSPAWKRRIKGVRVYCQGYEEKAERDPDSVITFHFPRVEFQTITSLDDSIIEFEISDER
jgi:hypothetical protein